MNCRGMVCLCWLIALAACLAACPAATDTLALHSEAVPVHVKLNADVVPKVGQEGVVTATVAVDYDLPNVSVEIELPTEGKVLDQPKRSLSRMQAGTPVAHTRRIRFSTAGAKFVRAVVRAEERPGVVWSAVDYLPLNIGTVKSQVGLEDLALPVEVETSGGATGTYIGQAAFSSRPLAGAEPPTLTESGGPLAEPPAGSDEPVPPGSLVVTGKWSFYDRGDVYTPQRDVLVELRRGSDGAHLEWTYTNWSGDYTFPSITNPGSAGVYVRCYTYVDYGTRDGLSCKLATVSLGGTEYGDCYTGNTSTYVFGDGTQSVGSWSITNGTANEKAWWIYDDMVKAFWVPPNRSGRHVAEWSPTSTHGTHYHPGGNIHLMAGDADDTPDTVLHEMGHSVMYNIYGNYMPPFPNCDPHYLMGSSSTGCGWTEGWAQTWHCWTTNDPIRSYPGGGGVNLENATWGDGYDQGDTVEGRVAGAIWDITDATNDGTDTYDGSWDDVWDVMWNVNCDTFAGFWSQWKARGHAKHGPVASIYQCTIDYNTWPTFSGLPNITTAEDTPISNAIDLWTYASDPESSDSQLTYTITGNTNTNCGVSIDSGDYVDVNPAANWYGTSTVTISCSDGIRTSTDSFTVTVTAVADAPEISGLPDKSLNEDTSLNNTIDLWAYTYDPESSDSALTFTITGNTNSNCGVSIDSNRYVDINPTANWYGTSDVTIRATDPGGLYSQDTFRITVNSVNDAPSISGLPDRSLNEDTSLDNTIDLWYFTYDPDHADSSLTFTITANTDPSCGVSIDSSRYIDINPAANWNGVSDVTVRATDPLGAYTQDTFRITVNPINDPPTLSGLPDRALIKNDTWDPAISLWGYASDPETPASELTYTITANTNPSCGATLYSNRYIKIAPAYNWTGNSYVTVRVTDPSGAWAEDQFEIVVGERCDTCAEARKYPDGAWVYVMPKTVTAQFPGVFYMEDSPTRVSGIRVAYTDAPTLNRRVYVAGQLTTYFAERMINCHILRTLFPDDSNPPKPLGMTNRDLGGESPNAYTPEVPLGRVGGLYNIGLLTRTTGTVVRSTGNFWIDDGSHVPYSSTLSALYVDWSTVGTPPPPVGARVAVTGISGATTLGGNAINKLRPRTMSDLKGMGGKVAFILDTDLVSAAQFADLFSQNGWRTKLVRMAELGRAVISDVDVVVVGSDTGTWGDSSKVAAIVKAGRPVIGVGSGGARFLDQVKDPDLSIGFLPSAVGSTDLGAVADTSLGLFYFDKLITIPVSAPIIAILSSASGCVEVYNPPASVTKILRDPQYATYWPIAQEDRYMQWGYYPSPGYMTQTGKDLFINCLYYMQGK